MRQDKWHRRTAPTGTYKMSRRTESAWAIVGRHPAMQPSLCVARSRVACAAAPDGSEFHQFDVAFFAERASARKRGIDAESLLL